MSQTTGAPGTRVPQMSLITATKAIGNSWPGLPDWLSPFVLVAETAGPRLALTLTSVSGSPVEFNVPVIVARERQPSVTPAWTKP